jgi:DNA-binding CsgD family transcriptional regulator
LDYRYLDEPQDSGWGWSQLTPRERQVARLVCQTSYTRTNAEIAASLAISPETVKIHVRHVLSKFNLHSKAELRRALDGWDFSETAQLGD